jgi:FG-GAP-like repeat/PASTA domain
VSRRFRGRPATAGARRWAVLLACVGVALGFGVVALSASARAPSFARSFLGTADSPAVAIGDLNGDRRADIVTANYNPESISVNLNRGGGRFTGREYPVGGLARSVAIGDLNGDGKPDVVTTNDTIDTSYTVSVLLNGGDGRLTGRHDYQVAKPDGVAIADLNGDGKPELAIASDAMNAVSVLRNRGDGTFLPGSAYATGRRPVYLTSSDFNGDGRLDLATANADADTVSVLLNQGDGTLQASHDYGSGRNPSSIAIADLNGDRHPDLATANRGAGTVSVLRGRGDGSFHPERDFRTGSGPFSIVTGDLNGDGTPDLASANSGPATVSVLLNRGDGSFRPKLDYAPSLELYGWGSIAIGDLNGDRRLDLAVPIIYSRNGATDLSLLINTPGLCNVQSVRGMTLSAAKDTLARINCRVGKVSRAYSRSIKRGRVISQKPGFGAVLPRGTQVNLVVSRGRKR